jgi:hypothetical protein
VCSCHVAAPLKEVLNTIAIVWSNHGHDAKVLDVHVVAVPKHNTSEKTLLDSFLYSRPQVAVDAADVVSAEKADTHRSSRPDGDMATEDVPETHQSLKGIAGALRLEPLYHQDLAEACRSKHGWALHGCISL